jgi:hypothetical protein
MARMKRDTMFEHKEVTFTYEENMSDVNDYQKLFKPFIKPKKSIDPKRANSYGATSIKHGILKNNATQIYKTLTTS